MFNDIDELVERVTYMVEHWINDNMKEAKPKELGLDARAGWRVFVNHTAIAVENSDRSQLDYYGGFEYIDSDCVKTVGDYTFYTSDDNRVQGHINVYFDKHDEEHGEDGDDFDEENV